MAAIVSGTPGFESCGVLRLQSMAQILLYKKQRARGGEEGRSDGVHVAAPTSAHGVRGGIGLPSDEPACETPGDRRRRRRKRRDGFRGHSSFQDADMGFVGFVGFLDPTQDGEIAEMLLQQLGAGRPYARERRSAVQRFTISEVYSPPRITKEIR